ncbi:MAG: benzoate-CoA ligase family protein [Acidobacteriia bacterium]|nr:benzoate-CoA ligase family protein [Terriglobia bacterium]
MMEAFNLADQFVDRHLREGRGEKIAIRCGDRAVTYAQVAEDTTRVGNGLRALGIQPPERVLIALPDGPEFAAAYFGAMKIGAVAVPTNPSLKPADYAYLLDESEAAALIVQADVHAQIEPVLADRRFLRHVIVCGPDWDEWLAAQSADLTAALTRAIDPAFWLWTSGSTGMPKAAVHLHRDWICCCENYAGGVLGITTDDVTFSSSKLFHAYGLGNGLMFPFHAGATTVLYPGRPQAAAILKAAQEFRPTLFFSVPTLYAAMLEDGGSYDLGSVRLAVSAAEPLPAEMFRRWKQRFGVEILDGIGSTEALHIYLSARAGKVRPGSTGEPVPGYEIRIVDAEGADVPRGSIGDLLVRGESTARLYWNRPDLSEQRMRDGWFYSGDKYWIDEDGYFWYAGRSDDMVRVSGQWVSPIEVESALVEHEAVMEAAVVGHTEPGGLGTVKAFVVLRQGFAGTDELIRDLQAFVRQRIAPYKYPRRVEFLAELPKNATGKLLRYKLRELDCGQAGL